MPVIYDFIIGHFRYCSIFVCFESCFNVTFKHIKLWDSLFYSKFVSNKFASRVIKLSVSSNFKLSVVPQKNSTLIQIKHLNIRCLPQSAMVPKTLLCCDISRKKALYHLVLFFTERASYIIFYTHVC